MMDPSNPRQLAISVRATKFIQKYGSVTDENFIWFPSNYIFLHTIQFLYRAFIFFLKIEGNI